MKELTVIILMICAFNVVAQEYSDNRYLPVYDNIDGQEAVDGKEAPKIMFFGSTMDYAIFTFANILWAGINDRREQQRLENDRTQSLGKINAIKSQYQGYDSINVKILDGWHNVIATDNANFCKDAKVLVKGNKIKRFVIDNCIPINFMATGSIKKAKAVITLKNFQGEALNVLDLFFLYDIEEQQIVDEPLRPGYVCFWTNNKFAEAVYLKMDNKPMERFTVGFDDEPEPFEKGTVCRILKPGMYSYSAEEKGPGKHRGTFEVKPGFVYMIKL